MKQLLITIAAFVLVGCATMQSPETPTAKAPDIDIHQAAADGNIKAIKQHLAAGKDVNAPDRNGWTPLHYAALKDREEIIELLIAKGANVNAKSVHGTPLVGHTPLDFAIKLKLTEIVDLIRKHGGKSGAADSIHVATFLGNIEAVKQHLAAGVDVNAKDDGWTPLHQAVRNGHKEIVELLIAEGADVNVKNDDGETPIDWAINFKQTETIALIRKHGGKTGEELKAEGK